MDDQLHKKLYDIGLKLEEVNESFKGIRETIADKITKIDTVERVKADPAMLKSFVYLMPTRRRHGIMVGQTDWAGVDVPKGLRCAGIVSEFGKGFAEARNAIMKAALQMTTPNAQGKQVPVDYGLWVDDDIILPRDAVIKFFQNASKHPVIAGVYYYKKPTQHPVNRKVDGTQMQYIDNETTGMDKCDFLAPTGCLWVDFKAVRNMQEPWFVESFESSNNHHGYMFGEDRHFTQLCVQSGVTPVVDKSIQCLHWDCTTNMYWGNDKYTDKGLIKLSVIDHFAVRRLKLMPFRH